MGVFVRVGSALVYSRQVEFGGLIEAKRGEFLRFIGRDGTEVFVRAVQQDPQPWLRPAMDATRGEFARLAGRVAEKMILDVAGGL